MSEKIDPDRRHFLGTVAMTIAAAQFGMIDSASAAQSSKSAVPPVKAGIVSITEADRCRSP